MRNIFKRGSRKLKKGQHDIPSEEEQQYQPQQQYVEGHGHIEKHEPIEEQNDTSATDSSNPSYSEDYSMEEMPQQQTAHPSMTRGYVQPEQGYYEQPQPQMTSAPKKKKKSLAKAGASAAVTDFVLGTIKRELATEVGSNFDVWADRFLDIIDMNTDLLKNKSIESAQLVKERIYYYDDIVRNKIGHLMDTLLAKIEMMDEKLGGKFNLNPGTISTLATGWVDDLEEFINQQLDILIQLIEQQIDLFIGRAHQRIDIAKSRTYEQSRKLKGRLSNPVPQQPVSQRQRRRPANVMM